MKASKIRATHEGRFELGKWHLHAFNLSNGMRVFESDCLDTVLGMHKDAGTRASLAALANHPVMKKHPLSVHSNLLSKSILFEALDGRMVRGVDADGLVDLSKFLLKARELGILRTAEQVRYAQAAEALIVSLAHVALAALIDEATGFQQVRKADALRAMLDKYLKKELAAWTKRFPDEFYEQIYRLKRWNWQGMSINRPQVVGRYTNDIVYQRLAPGILLELERLNPERLARHHQWLTEDIGHPALAQHLHAVIALMRVSKSWEKFRYLLHEAFPVKGDQLELELDDGLVN